MTRALTSHTVESLLARTEEEGDCRLWTGFLQNKMVPVVFHEGKLWSVRKLIATLEGRKVPSTGAWSTRCGCKSCVAPAHIMRRAPKEHIAHMQKTMFSNATLVAVRNTKLGLKKRKVTDAMAAEIRGSNESHVAIAKRLGLSVGTIKKWRYGQVGATLADAGWMSMLRIGR